MDLQCFVNQELLSAHPKAYTHKNKWLMKYLHSYKNMKQTRAALTRLDLNHRIKPANKSHDESSLQ